MPGSVTVIDTAALKVIGFEQLASLGSAVALTAATIKGAKGALISADGQSVRVRFDGTNPTTAIGHLIANGDHLFIMGNLAGIRIIQTTATAVANCTYFA